MKTYLILLLSALTLVSQEVTNSKAAIAWDDFNPVGFVTNSTIKVYAGEWAGTNFLRSVTVPSNIGIVTNNANVFHRAFTVYQVPILTIMDELPNGVYTLTCDLTDDAGLTSEASQPLVIFWYAKPQAPSRPKLFKWINNTTVNTPPPAPPPPEVQAIKAPIIPPPL